MRQDRQNYARATWSVQLVQPGNAGCHLDSGAVQVIFEAGRRLVESLGRDLRSRKLPFMLKTDRCRLCRHINQLEHVYRI